MPTNNQFKSITAAKSAVKKAGLGADYDVIQNSASSGDPKYGNGYFYVVFYCDGYDCADEDREYIRSVGFAAQKFPSSDLGYKKKVVHSHREKDVACTDTNGGWKLK